MGFQAVGGKRRVGLPIMPSATLPTVAVGASALVLTLAVVAIPSLRPTYANDALFVVVETTTALIAALVAFLAYGRFRQDRRAQDFWLVAGVVLLASSNLVRSLLPEPLPQNAVAAVTVWISTITRTLGAGALAVAAFSGRRRLAPAQARATAALLALALVFTGSIVAALAILPPVETEVVAGLTATSWAHVRAGVVTTTHLVHFAMLGVAAAGFLRRAGQLGDRMASWLAAGTVALALGRLHFALFPEVHAHWFYTGDLLRVAGYSCWLIGCGFEIAAYWRTRTEVAVLGERRRIARELHDGLAQELAFIHSQVHSIAPERPPGELVHHIAASARRALDESRHAIDVLAEANGSSPAASSLRQAVQAAVGAADVELRCAIDLPGQLHPHIGSELCRIAGEAVRNAVRHGQPGSITVEAHSTPTGPVVLRVTDNGRGCNPAVARPGGFGLRSMAERARLLGGSFRLTSPDSGGTQIDVVLPTSPTVVDSFAPAAWGPNCAHWAACSQHPEKPIRLGAPRLRTLRPRAGTA